MMREPVGIDRIGSDASPPVRRWRGERGTAIITASVLIFSLTAAAILHLARDVDRVVTNRSAAQSIAFQSARAGAQQVDVDALRAGGWVSVDESDAAAEAVRVGGRLLDAYGLAGSVSSPQIDGDVVTVTVIVDDRDGTVSATASVRAETGP